MMLEQLFASLVVLPLGLFVLTRLMLLCER